jgi:prepilin-type N-terminal cleavage/methylation domain-containing protein
MELYNPTNAIEFPIVPTLRAGTPARQCSAREPKVSKSPRLGFTLIEMLVVIGIMLLMVGAAATLMQPASESRRAREAGRSLNVYCSNARNRALTNGRPCGVTFHCFSTTGPAFAMTVDQCETPPFYAGDTDASAAQIQQINAADPTTFSVRFTDAGPTTDMVKPGDTIQFNEQGYSYRITSTAAKTITVVLPSTPGAITPWPVGPTNWSIAMPYRIIRGPMKGIATPLQLPARVVVDLQWSGWGGVWLGTPYASGTYAMGDTVKYSDGIVYVSKHDTNTASPPTTADWEPLTDFTILFSPTGSADKIYCNGYGRQINDKIYLLLGRRDRVSNAFTAGNSNETTLANVQDAENALWLTVNPQSGVIATEKVAVSPGTVAASRTIAEQGQGMGGR